MRRAARGRLSFDDEGVVREPWLVDDDMREARVFHPHPVVDALVPYYVLRGVSPAELLEHNAWRTAYFARYGRISPAELEAMDPEHRERVLLQLGKLVEAEQKVRSANPFDPTTEDTEPG